jgi:hypothetical protein
MSLPISQLSKEHSRLFTILLSIVLVFMITVGLFARNEWFPSVDNLTGEKRGWFGTRLSKQASSIWNPFAEPMPTTAPQPSKEYLYFGNDLLAVEDANALAAAPADLAVWRSTTGTWWVMGGAAGSQPATQVWGLNSDKPVQGDYDGDGKTDFSIYRPSTGQWFVLQSSDNAWAPVISWGLSTDTCVPADYDGDGRTDRAIWRDGIWYIVRSSDQATVYQPYGLSTDKPAPADHDGDGRADLTVWRASEQRFHSINSSTGSVSMVSLQQPGNEPVSGDYDGDGRADHAVRNGTNWVIRRSSNEQIVTVVWGLATDIAVENDYDGDGKLDIATWRDSNGTWYIRQSAFANSLRQVQWGIPGDTPVPSFYRR